MAVKYKTVKAVTVQSLSFKKVDELAFKVEAPMHVGNKIKEDEDKEPAIIMRVIELESGALYDLIVPALLKTALEENYPDASYVGKSFVAVKRDIPGKRYKGYDVSEIELEADHAPKGKR